MTEIKRLNYFTSQFLVEKDFQDEQAYHRRMRHLHNRSLHNWGVVEGLDVIKSGDKQVSVNSGLAIDSNGNEIVVIDEQPAEIKTVSLSEFEAGNTIYITIAAQDFEDEQDSYTLGSETKYTRTTERPQLEARSTEPADDGAVIVLAEVQLDSSGNVDDNIDNSVRRLASVNLPPGATLSGPLTIGEKLTVSGDFEVTGNVNAPLNVTSNVSISENLTVGGNLEVKGDVIARDTEHIAGNVSLGDADNDEVKVTGVIRSGHSSGALRVDDALHTTGSVTVDGNVGIGKTNPSTKLEVDGTVKATKFQGDGSGLTGISVGGTKWSDSSSNRIYYNAGNVGIGTDNPTEKLEVDGTVKATKFEGDGSVGTAELANNSVTNAKIANDAVSAAKIQNASVGNAELANNSVTNVKIADNAVNAAKIQNGTVGNAELANNSVTNIKIANDAVSAAKIQNGSVGNAELANNSVTNFKIADNAVNAAKIQDGTVGTAELANNSVTNAKIANNSISMVKLDDATRRELAKTSEIESLQSTIRNLEERIKKLEDKTANIVTIEKPIEINPNIGIGSNDSEIGTGSNNPNFETGSVTLTNLEITDQDSFEQ